MWDLVGNPEDRFSQNEAHIKIFFDSDNLYLFAGKISCSVAFSMKKVKSFINFEPVCMLTANHCFLWSFLSTAHLPKILIPYIGSWVTERVKEGMLFH